MAIELQKHQELAISRLSNGKVLFGGVGSGKTFTALGYYLKNESDKDLVVITTAKVRDELDWINAASEFNIGPTQTSSIAGNITVDSWNNIKKYTECEGKFFIFDEQRLVGTGAWVKSFLKIVKNNRWILLSATPGDTWLDYAAVFVANGWFKNISEFKRQHVRYAPYSKFPSVLGYYGESRLEAFRNHILVEMPYEKHTTRYVNYIEVESDLEEYTRIARRRWNPFTEEPIRNSSELFSVLRKVVNSDDSRIAEVVRLLDLHPRLVVFYNFNYELEALRGLSEYTSVYEWNGHQKDQLPEGRDGSWVYLVQYTSGAEGWNCIDTDAMVFYSMTYSYKGFEQAQGRIDRLNTPYDSLYYYVLTSRSPIDKAIKAALGAKKNFNERVFLAEMGVE